MTRESGFTLVTVHGSQFTPFWTHLRNALFGEGYADEDVSFIHGAGQKWERYYTPELKAWVREREDFLFRLFPEFDV